MVEDLVYDVGLHRGEDTAFYLAKGYRVVGIEADPSLAAHCRERFAEEIADGRLRIVEGAIAPENSGTVTFYRHSTKSDWGTLNTGWAERNVALEDGSIERLDVPVVDLVGLLRETGTPHYMKIDIEGTDQACLRSLFELEDRPRYLSVESAKESLGAVRSELDLLASLGYTRFAVVQQESVPGSTVEVTRRDGTPLQYTFEPHGSGLFGDDIEHWLDRRQAERRYMGVVAMYRAFGDTAVLRRVRASDFALNAAARVLPFSLPGWYDTHASR